MAVKFYKKLSPSTKVVIGSGESATAIEFTTLNQVTCYYATDHEFVQNEFARLMREQRYGISEISAEEFTRDYVDEKKNLSSLPRKNWREELSRSTSSPGLDPVGRLGSGQVAAALRVEGSRDVQINKPGLLSQVGQATSMGNGVPSGLPVTMAEPSEAPSQTPKKFVPNVGKRKPNNKR